MLLLWVVLAAIVVVVERRTAFGRYLYALGSNRTVATLSGVPVVRTTITAYAISGMTAALAGILLTGYSRQAYLGMGDPYLFTSIAAVAIGGASILGGTGSYLGTIAGALVLTILTGVLPIFRLDAGALQDHLRPGHPGDRLDRRAVAARAVAAARLKLMCTFFQRRFVNVSP